MPNKTFYFRVIAKCGHVGRCNYIPIAFPVIAESGKEAARVARNIPRVKHHQKFAILRCDKITYEDFEELKRINESDPYLKCTNKRELSEISNLEERVVNEKYHKKDAKKTRADRVNHKLLINKALKMSAKDEIYEYTY